MDESPAEAEGLAAEEASRRLAADGPNELSPEQAGVWRQALDSLWRQPLVLLLFAAAAVYALLGESSEALALLASVVVAAGISLYQRVRTSRVLAALRDLAAPRALVWRDGAPRRIASLDVVVGDLLLVREGDRVAADALVLAGANLIVDEALLTGESEPVRKFAGGALFANTLVLGGTARARVNATGARTQFGKIGVALKQVHEPAPPLERDIDRLARWFGVLGGGLCLVVVLVVGAWYGEWMLGLLRGITLAMAVLPEEFPLVVTVFLALGAWRLARVKVLTRRPGAIEALGALTVLCVDKTGTLTQNRMALVRCGPAQGVQPSVLARSAALACETQPVDPMDTACLRWAVDLNATPHSEWALLQAHPFTQGRCMVTQAWRVDDGIEWAAKGAPEHVMAQCGLVGDALAEALKRVQLMAEDGTRVLAVARARVDGLAADPFALQFEYLGLIGFRDPLRPEVPDAVRAVHQAGIRLLMITGDHPSTATAVAREAGLSASPRAVTGDEVAGWSDAELPLRLRQVDVVSRATPHTKLRLVQRLQAAGDVVAMTGDGVNDAPALRAAHVGVAMGQRGSDVAREAGGLVLLEDDFGSLVAGISQGRRIFLNLRQALLYVVAVHVPIAGVCLLPLLAAGTAPMLLPMHVMFLEFVIDPACSIVFEAERESPDPMVSAPRPAQESVLGVRLLLLGLAQGLTALAGVLGVYVFARVAGLSDAETRAATVTAVVALNVGLILHNRSPGTGLARRLRAANPVFWMVSGGAAAAWCCVLMVPALRSLFQLALPDATVWLAVGAIVSATLALLEGAGRRRRAKAEPHA